MQSQNEIISLLLGELRHCDHISPFDECFLSDDRYDTSSLEQYSPEKWQSLIQKRNTDLLGSEYDPTRFDRTVNRVWWQFASAYFTLLSLSTKYSLIDFIFPGVHFTQKDELTFFESQSASLFFYSDDNSRLMSIKEIFLYLRNRDRTQFSSYTSDGQPVPLSLYEAQQIRSKVDLYYDKATDQMFELKMNGCATKSPAQITYQFMSESGMRTQLSPDEAAKKLTSSKPIWEYITRDCMPAPSKRVSNSFTDLFYPLFSSVKNYFNFLHLEKNNHPRDQLKQMLSRFQASIRGLYSTELQYLTIHSTNTFYAYKISVTNQSSSTLLDVLLDCMTCSSFEDVLPQIVALSQWISAHDPSMILQRPQLCSYYSSVEIGPYVTRSKLLEEILCLKSYHKDLTIEESSIILDLIAQLSLMTLSDHDLFIDESIFSTIHQLFVCSDKRVKCSSFLESKSGKLQLGSYEFVYYQKGVNAQYIRIAQLLSGWGYLQRHSVEDYRCLLMPSLVSPIDPISGEYLSHYPLSHCAMPSKDRTYLCVLPNSVRNYEITGCFYDVNGPTPKPFTQDVYDLIKAYAAPKFRLSKYVRVPKQTVYPLKASSLKALVDLVNNSLNYDGLDDAYSVQRVHTFPRQLLEHVIYFKIDVTDVSYRVLDLWNQDCIYSSGFSIVDPLTGKSFADLFNNEQSSYIISLASKRGHVRPNYSQIHYYRTYIAYTRFRDFYANLPFIEKNHLNNTTMKFAGLFRTFGEVYADGFPDCMSAASKWFSTLILDYLPNLKFSASIENHIKSGYLNEIRYQSRNASVKRTIENDLYHSNDNNPDHTLDNYLTHESSKNSWTSWGLHSLNLFGLFTSHSIPVDEDAVSLLSIVDLPRIKTQEKIQTRSPDIPIHRSPVSVTKKFIIGPSSLTTETETEIGSSPFSRANSLGSF